MKNGKILIVGGYGGVGRQIARRLSSEFPSQIIVAGRSYDKASAFAEELEGNVSPLAFDIQAAAQRPELLDRVALVVMCIDQLETDFVELCISRGIDYLDVTAGHGFFTKLEAFNKKAIDGNSTVVLSVGLAPGLTNLLAKNVHSKIEDVGHIDIFLMLGLGEKHGEAAVRWTVENFATEFSIRDKHDQRRVWPFHEGKSTVFPEGLGRRKAYRFNFPDQHVIIRTLEIPSAASWLCFDSALTTNLLALSERLGGLRLLRLRSLRNIVVRILRSFQFGSDIFAAKAQAYSLKNPLGGPYESTMIGNNETRATAIIASDVAREIYKSPLSAGVFHLEQLIDPQIIFQSLQDEGFRFIS